jgi:asparagine synthase (glutamine-hydrolysing)
MAQQYAWQITGINDDEQRWLGSSSCRGFRDTVTLPAGVKEPLNRLLAYDCTNHLPDLYLMKADKATMAHSVEERVPILDRELIAFAFTIPPKYKIFQGTEKYIWRRALADLVPPEILHRPKRGFSVPYTGWIAGELRESAIQALDEGPLCRKLFDPAQVQKLFATLSRGGCNRSPLVLWNLFALERWAAVFGLREIAEDPAPATTGFRGSG